MAMSRGRPLCQLVDEGFHALMSSKFDGSVEEQRVRAVTAELQTLEPCLKTYIVDAGATGTFGDLTDEALAGAHTAICFCSPNYGQKTKSTYSSFAEVKYADNKHLNILPIQLCDTFPPAPTDTWPPPGGGKAGANQNDRVFAEDTIRIDGRGKTPRQIAIEINEHLHKQIEASKAHLRTRVKNRAYQEGEYTGEWSTDANMPDGQGTWSWAGKTYEGEWKAGRWHGQGKYMYADGDTREGTFEDHFLVKCKRCGESGAFPALQLHYSNRCC